MASVTLVSVADTFPVGTVVGAYAVPTRAERQTVSAPSTGAITTATVQTNGSLTFSHANLLPGVDYVAYATVNSQIRVKFFKIAAQADQTVSGSLAHTGPAVGFFGKTPAAQPAAIASPAGGTTVDTQARAAIDSIRAALQSLGLTA